MATSQQIDRAASRDRIPVGTEYMASSHLLAIPSADRDREYRISERRRARNAVHRLAGPHEAEILAALGLDKPTAEEASLERERVRDYDALPAEAFPSKPSPKGTP